MSQKTPVVFLLCLLLAVWPAAPLVVDVTSGDWRPINIFVELFLGENRLPGEAQVPSDIIAADLSASGQFRVHKDNRNSKNAIDEKRLAEIREQGGEYLLTGAVALGDDGAGGEAKLEFALYDALTGDAIGSYVVSFSPDNQRLAAHNVSNWIYEEIVGKPGVFHTKVVYVLRRGNENELKIADYDGYNRQTILTSQTQLISPAWSPDGNEVLYVSFERNKPLVYRQSLLTGKRTIVANFKGSNSAPAMSPDGRRIAAALTEHGGAQQIYLIDDNSKTRLRVSGGIDTEPVFSPDGGRLAFTSDEHGSPQIYEHSFDTGESRRLTFGSRYNASPNYSSAGDSIVFVRRENGGDNIAVMDLPGGDIAILTENGRADSPSFSPNDDMIIFRDEKNKNNLATLSINGKVIMFWEEAENGEIINPSWSPLKSDWF